MNTLVVIDTVTFFWLMGFSHTFPVIDRSYGFKNVVQHTL